MKPQEIFDKVSQHMINQNQFAMYGNECQYYTPHGLKCAAGCLLTDDESKDLQSHYVAY